LQIVTRAAGTYILMMSFSDLANWGLLRMNIQIPHVEGSYTGRETDCRSALRDQFHSLPNPKILGPLVEAAVEAGWNMPEIKEAIDFFTLETALNSHDNKGAQGPFSFQSVVVETISPVGLKHICSVTEAAHFLMFEWPDMKGPMRLNAKMACDACMNNRLSISEARLAFVEAAIEADIYFSEGR
jgi:hypothetical protein